MKTLFLIVFTLLTSAHCQLEWQEITSQGSLIPPPRRDAGLGYDDNRGQLILFGGRPGPLDDTWIFNISSGMWHYVNTSTHPEGRFSFVSGLHGDYFYIATGEGKNKKFYNDIWQFDLITETWEELPAQSRPPYLSERQWQGMASSAFRPEARYGSAGGIHAHGTMFYVNQGFAMERYFDTLTYDVVNKGWSVVDCPGQTCNPYNPSYPHARCLHAGAMASPHELVIFGGCMTGGSTGGACPAGDTWIYNGQTKKWKEVEGCPSPRVYGTMALLPSSNGSRRLVLYGGREDHRQVLRTTISDDDEVSILDPDGAVWKRQKTRRGTTVPGKRVSASMATASTGVYMFGGVELETSSPKNDLWLLMGTSADTQTAQMLSCTKHFANWILLHGIFMTIGWGVFLTWGAIIARYFSSTGKLWFLLHVSFQVLGLLMAIAGFVFAILSVQFDHFKFTHGIIGLVTMILGILQPFNAIFRSVRAQPGDARSLQRKIWEFIHHFGGRAALALALINISLGVFVAVAHLVIWAVWYAYLGLLVLLFLIGESVRGFTKEKRHIPRQAQYEMTGSENQNTNGHKSYTNPGYDDDMTPIKE